MHLLQTPVGDVITVDTTGQMQLRDDTDQVTNVQSCEYNSLLFNDLTHVCFFYRRLLVMSSLLTLLVKCNCTMTLIR